MSTRTDVNVRRGIAPLPAATLALAAGCWLVSIVEMRGMDMGTATRLGSLASFIALWVPMMAAMMLPAALPAVVSVAREHSRPIAGARFVVSYLAVWALFGVAAHTLYRQHGHAAAGVLTVLAGVYELTPLKRACRERCRERARSGGRFGVYCVGSSAGLMAILLGLGVMSVTLMVAIAAIVLAQKLLPPRPVLDVAVAFAIVGFGVLVIVAPALVAT
jgi:predicted metal-binding membrane protein